MCMYIFINGWEMMIWLQIIQYFIDWRDDDVDYDIDVDDYDNNDDDYDSDDDNNNNDDASFHRAYHCYMTSSMPTFLKHME